MLRSKDFYSKRVYDLEGENLGLVEDLCIDFYNSKILGVFLSRKSIFSKKNFIKISNIVSFGEDIIVDKIEKNYGLKLKSILGLDVIGKEGNMRGVCEDLLIEEENFFIKGLIVSTGIIYKFINGKDIILLDDCILCEDYILYKSNSNISLKIMPKRIF